MSIISQLKIIKNKIKMLNGTLEAHMSEILIVALGSRSQECCQKKKREREK